jgi:hypothetical protein
VCGAKRESPCLDSAVVSSRSSRFKPSHKTIARPASLSRHPGGADPDPLHSPSQRDFYQYNNQPNARKFVSSIDLAAYNNQRATYTFNYSDYISIAKDCDDTYAGAVTKTRFLNSITLPDGTAFGMTYNTVGTDNTMNTCSVDSGHLLSLTQPTGARISYTVTQRYFPSLRMAGGVGRGGGLPGTWRDHSSAVAGRTISDQANNVVSSLTYDSDITDLASVLIQTSPPRYATTGRSIFVTVTDSLNQMTAYYFDADLIGNAWGPNCDFDNGSIGANYGMPFTMAGATADGRLLSSEDYPSACLLAIPLPGDNTCARTCNNSSGQVVPPTRSTYVVYEKDTTAAVLALSDQNRRLRVRRTAFHDDVNCGGECYEETSFDDFDGLGHYRTATHHSNLTGTSDRVAKTHFSARGGTYVPNAHSDPNTYMIAACTNPISPCSSWLPNVYDYMTTAENGQTAETDFCFDPGTSFLTRLRTRRSGDSTTDLLAVFGQTAGNVTSESYSGGDPCPNGATGCTPLPSGFATFSGTPPTPKYSLTHHYTYGTRDTTQYSGVNFKSLDLTIDQNTGHRRRRRSSPPRCPAFPYASSIISTSGCPNRQPACGSTRLNRSVGRPHEHSNPTISTPHGSRSWRDDRWRYFVAAGLSAG